MSDDERQARDELRRRLGKIRSLADARPRSLAGLAQLFRTSVAALRDRPARETQPEDDCEIYLDHAANTPIGPDPRVFEAMRPWLTERFGNAAALHRRGREAERALEDARELIAGMIGAKPTEVLFTASATESNNAALKGVAFARGAGHLITTAIEHDCVQKAARWLQTQGFALTELPVDEHGRVDPAELEQAIRDDTILVSIMAANNEIGTVQPIEALGTICKARNVPFHTDAAQVFGKLSMDVQAMHLALMTVSSHKMHGPLGIAALYVREGVELTPLLHGGGHEFGLRSSTSNVAGAVGFAEAARLASEGMTREAEQQRKLRDRLIEAALTIEGCHLTGHPTERLPGNASFWIEGLEGRALVALLDAGGVAAATGSACISVGLEPSHVLQAIGLTPEQARGSLRLSLGRGTTRDDVERAVTVLKRSVAELRQDRPPT